MSIKVDHPTTIDESFIECGDCRNFTFFEYSEHDEGKCNRDSLYDYKLVKSTDRRCRNCASCTRPYIEYGIWKCEYRDQIGFSVLDLFITPECKYYNSNILVHGI